MTSSFHETTPTSANKDGEGEATDNDEEEPSLEDTIAQLSTHGVDYLRYV